MKIKITDQVDHNYFTGDAVYYTPEKTQIETTLPDGTLLRKSLYLSNF